MERVIRPVGFNKDMVKTLPFTLSEIGSIGQF